MKFHPAGDALHKDGKTRERILGGYATPTQAGVWLQSNGQTGSVYSIWSSSGVRVQIQWAQADRQAAAIMAGLVVLYRSMGCSDEESRALAMLPRPKVTA